MTTRAASALRLAGLAAAALLASGCAVFSPVQTSDAYVPADGVDLTIPGLDLRNVAIVADAKGSPGTVIGQAVNNGADAVEVTFGVEGGQGSAKTSVPAFSGGSLTSDTKVELSDVPVAPGSMVRLVVSTPQAGQNVVLVPVLAPERYYEGLAPSPSPSAS